VGKLLLEQEKKAKQRNLTINIHQNQNLVVDKVSNMNINEIKPNPNNPRLIKDHKFKQLVKSIQDFPQMLELRPIVIDENNMVLGGNMRLKACKEAGLTDVPVIHANNLTEEKKREFIIKDNVAFGEHNWDELANSWNVEELTEWGLDIPNFEVNNLEAEEDDFAVPDGGIETDIVLGDLFEIGEHRLLCGDSTDSDQVAKLMNGQKAEIAFTSPPYNAGTTPTEVKMGKSSKYANDDDDKSEQDYLKLLVDFTNNTLLFCDYSFINIQSLSGNKIALIDFLYEMKSYYADTMIWQKGNAQPAMANNVLNSQFEYVHCFSHKANRSIVTKQFRGTISNVIEISKQTKNKVKEHNATFPVDFANFFISNFCENSIIDLFCGSGTTMIVAHQLKRKCYGMELDPKYCQVIVDRMRKLDPSLIIKKNGVPL
jgi:DNA modification methylase